MKLSDFILLNKEEKTLTVLHQGILVGKRANPQNQIFLFQLEGYYVETFCNLKDRSVEEFRVFGDTKFLTPYLEKISITDLLN